MLMKVRSSLLIPIRAAVLRETGYPLRIESLELEGPRQDEVVVRWWPSPRSHGR
jgi:Zn-dependent alcohol dehydrogenase